DTGAGNSGVSSLCHQRAPERDVWIAARDEVGGHAGADVRRARLGIGYWGEAARSGRNARGVCTGAAGGRDERQRGEGILRAQFVFVGCLSGGGWVFRAVGSGEGTVAGQDARIDSSVRVRRWVPFVYWAGGRLSAPRERIGTDDTRKDWRLSGDGG